MKKAVILILVVASLLSGCYPNPTFYDVAYALQSHLASWMQNTNTGQIFAYYKVGITSTGEAIYRWALMAADGTEIVHSGPTLLTHMLEIVNFRIAEGFRYITYFDIDPVAMTTIIVTIMTYLPLNIWFIYTPAMFKIPTPFPPVLQSYP